MKKIYLVIVILLVDFDLSASSPSTMSRSNSSNFFSGTKKPQVTKNHGIEMTSMQPSQSNSSQTIPIKVRISEPGSVQRVLKSNVLQQNVQNNNGVPVKDSLPQVKLAVTSKPINQKVKLSVEFDPLGGADRVGRMRVTPSALQEQARRLVSSKPQTLQQVEPIVFLSQQSVVSTMTQNKPVAQKNQQNELSMFNRMVEGANRMGRGAYSAVANRMQKLSNVKLSDVTQSMSGFGKKVGRGYNGAKSISNKTFGTHFKVNVKVAPEILQEVV